jgi:hypothetical protein
MRQPVNTGENFQAERRPASANEISSLVDSLILSFQQCSLFSTHRILDGRIQKAIPTTTYAIGLFLVRPRTALSSCQTF